MMEPLPSSRSSARCGLDLPRLFCFAFWAALLSMQVRGSDEPRLSIAHTPNGITVSWPGWASGWVLEHTTRLERPVPWKRVAQNDYQTNGPLVSVTVTDNNPTPFYRLRKLYVPAGQSGYWRFDEGLGAESAEESGFGLPLLADNAAWSAGRIGPAALQFQGLSPAQAWIDNADFQILPRKHEPFSLSFWFSPDELTSEIQGLIGTDSRSSQGWRIALHSPDLGTNYLVWEAIGGSLSVSGRTLLLPRQWYHLTATYDGRKATLYLDHNIFAEGIGTLLMHNGPIYLGGLPERSPPFNGRIDELRTYTNCLSPDQIALAAHWNFENDAATWAFDSSIYGHHARILGGAIPGPGRNGRGLETASGMLRLNNEYFTVLPPTGKPFSLSLWLNPNIDLPGQYGIVGCADGDQSGWQLVLDAQASGVASLRVSSINSGGTLDLRAPVNLTNSVWTKLDLTFNGGIATLFQDGRKLASANGAIRASRAPVSIGAAPGVAGFKGVIDDVKFFLRDRDEAEIGPVASVMWETVILNTSTNLTLQGRGPAGKTLTYNILNTITPTNGTLAHSPASPVVTYRAGARKGPDAFVYTVSDGEFTSPPATVILSVVQPHWLVSSGDSTQPADGRSPATAWIVGTAAALDAIWKTNNYYDCFFYGPGVYETSGWKYLERRTANPGCKHIGSGYAGSAPTVLKLVNARETWAEEMIFAASYNAQICDNFEVHNMLLNCNAPGNPKYIRGEPMFVRVPLVATSRVETATLVWGAPSSPWRLGRAAEFSVCTPGVTTGTLLTNCQTHLSTGNVDTVTIGAVTDELVLQLEQRAREVDFYSLAEIRVAGAEISLPIAKDPTGADSQLEPETGTYSIGCAFDDDPDTAWASGVENQVELFFPLETATAVTGLTIHWNCRQIAGDRQLGPASEYLIRARDPHTGQYYDVPFVRHPRTPKGVEVNTFGTEQSPSSVLTDRVVLVLNSRESYVDHYSLREVTLQNGSEQVALRIPKAHSTLGNYSILRAFDNATNTQWACGTQGSISAINLVGNNLKFTGLKVIGFGTKAGRECFPLFIGFWPTPEHPRAGNVLVEDCLFTEPATNNTDGLSTVTLVGAAGALTNAVVRRCAVIGVKPHFTYSGAFGANHVENCVVDDCMRGVYFEPDFVTDNWGPVLIRSNQFINVNAGVYLFSYPGRQFDSLTCVGNEIVLSELSGYAFANCDVCVPGPSGSMTNVTMLHNIIRYADWLPRPGNVEGGLMYSDVRHAVFANNLIALGTPNSLRVRHCPAGLIPPPRPPQICEDVPPPDPEDPTYPPCADVLRPGYRRAWFNNHDLSGNLLQVHCINNHIDGPATQQQWTD